MEGRGGWLAKHSRQHRRSAEVAQPTTHKQWCSVESAPTLSLSQPCKCVCRPLQPVLAHPAAHYHLVVAWVVQMAGEVMVLAR